MKLPGLRTAGAILCFHGITTPEQPGESLAHVPLPLFRAFIEAARQMGELVPLSLLLRRQREGRGTSNLIAITADDAYVSLSNCAAEYVTREAIPLTVFPVTQSVLGGGARFWWDRIDDLFPRVPAERWRAFEDACALDDEFRRGQPADAGPLRPFRQWMLATHRGRWSPALEPRLQALERDVRAPLGAQRSMNLDELTRFAAIPGVEVGVHTRSHPVLPLLSDEELKEEISAAYQVLREHFANALPILALPFGLFDARTLAAARDAGMAASLTLSATTLKRHRGRDDLPRFCLCRHDRPAKLVARLTGFFDRRDSIRRYPALPSATT